MMILYPVIGLIASQRLAELVYARRNERKLIARGGFEVGRGHYLLFILLHALWLASMLVLVDPATEPNWILLGLMVALQGLRFWVVASLGPYWTTRIITLPGAPLIRSGPFRYVRHPNYLVVTAEILVLPLAFNAPGIAAVFSLLNLLLLAWRIRVEEQALQPRRQV